MTNEVIVDTRPDVPSAGRPELADALFTTTQQRVLALLFGQPARSFFTTELIDLANCGRGAVQRELQRLTGSGLVIVSKRGNQKHYQANPGSPVFAELHSIVNKVISVYSHITQSLQPIANQLSVVLVYGPGADQTLHLSEDQETDQSEAIDLLLVASDSNIDLTLDDIYRALEAAQKRLGRSVSPSLFYTFKEFAERRKNNNTLLSQILNGSHVLLLGSLDDE